MRVSPIEHFSGRERCWRLNRGGDRQAKSALHRIVHARLRFDPRTRDYYLPRPAPPRRGGAERARLPRGPRSAVFRQALLLISSSAPLVAEIRLPEASSSPVQAWVMGRGCYSAPLEYRYSCGSGQSTYAAESQETPDLLGRTMNSGRLRSIARVTFGNRVSQTYLALVAVATIFLLLGGSTDSPAGLPVLVVAMPTILIMLLAEALFSDFGSTPSWIACASAVASVLIQSWFIGTIVSLARTGQWLPGRPQAK